MPDPKPTFEKINTEIISDIGNCYNCKDSKPVDIITNPLTRICKNKNMLCPDNGIPMWCPLRIV